MDRRELERKVDVSKISIEVVEEEILRIIDKKIRRFSEITKLEEYLLNATNDFISEKVIIKNINFPEYFKIKLFRKLVNLEFNNCQFNSIIDLGLNQNVIVKFNKCNFYEEWEHIEVKEALYSNCNFTSYNHINPSENKDKIKNLLFYDCSFDEIDISGAIFEKRLFKFSNTNKYYKMDKLKFERCEFKEDFILVSQNEENKRFFIKEINLEHSQFHKKVKIQLCDILNGNFYNTKFIDLADFYQSVFEQVNFERTDFLSISVFSESYFKCNVSFNYVKFWGKAIFRDTVIEGELNLRDSIFNTEANFLNITSVKIEKNGEPYEINIKNRETARIIKNFYDTSNNIIEANRFYKLEMKKREEELNSKENNNWFERLIFNIHGITSNHSQNALLALFWICIVGVFASYFSFYTIQNKLGDYVHFSMLPFLGTMALSFSIIGSKYIFKRLEKVYYYFVFVFFPLLYYYTTNDSWFTLFANTINPFSIMTKGETLNLGMLIFKVIIAYLIYQFIVSVRQNTRRK